MTNLQDLMPNQLIYLQAKSPYLSSKEKLESQLIDALINYIVLRKSDPACEVLEDLISLELKAGEEIGKILKKQRLENNLKGTLATVLCGIPWGKDKVLSTES